MSRVRAELVRPDLAAIRDGQEQAEPAGEGGVLGGLLGRVGRVRSSSVGGPPILTRRESAANGDGSTARTEACPERYALPEREASMTRNRTGSLTAATWLIGLGIVFLVQRAADLPWSQAWPMFLILIGVASFVTTILHGRYVYGGLWAFTWPVAWIVVGSILLASTTGRIGTEPGRAHRRLLAVGARDPRHLVRDRRVRAQRPGPDGDAPAAARRRIGGTRPDRATGPATWRSARRRLASSSTAGSRAASSTGRRARAPSS